MKKFETIRPFGMASTLVLGIALATSVPTTATAQTAPSVSERVVQFAVEEAPTAPSGEKKLSGDDLTAKDLELTDEEKVLSQNLMREKEAVNVAEQYRELLMRDALTIKPSERGDPMVVPFIADKVLLEQMTGRMNEAWTMGNYEQAMIFAKNIAKQFPDTAEADQARELIAQVMQLKDEGADINLDTSQDPRLDPWVRANTNSILYDKDDPVILIGPEIYRVGDSVDGHDDHVIDEIKENSVIFRVSNEFKTKRIELIVQSAP